MGALVPIEKGQIFARLTVVRRVRKTASAFAQYLCKCSCGGRTIARGTMLRRGETKSCGCLQREIAARSIAARKPNLKTGKSLTAEGCAFYHAKQRCTYLRHKQWKDYGGRGIRFRFASLAEFLNCIGPKPSSKHSLDRIDNDGNYEPGNVRWATQKEQANNTRKSRRVN